MNADTGEVIAALPLAGASGNDKLRKPDYRTDFIGVGQQDLRAFSGQYRAIAYSRRYNPPYKYAARAG